jgi:hypothetical protein
LAGCLTRPVNVENQEVVALPIPQATWLFLLHQRTGQQIPVKKGSQAFNGCLVKHSEKAAEC